MKYLAITFLSSVATFFSDAKWCFVFFFCQPLWPFPSLFLYILIRSYAGSVLITCLRRVFPGRQGGGRGEPKMLYQHPQNLKVLGWCSFRDRGLEKYLSASSKTEQWQIIWKGLRFQGKMFFMHSPSSLLYTASRENTFSFIKLDTSLNRLSVAHNSESIRIYSEK